MLADVQMTIQDEVRGDTLIRSGRALLDKTEGNIKFIDQVMMEQGINRLTADRVVVFFDAEERAIQRIKAIDKAVLVMSGAGVAGLRLSAERTGTRVLRSRLIDIVFRPDRSLQELTAGPEGGELIIEPSRLPQSKRRRIVADLLVMSFDPLGRLEKVYGRRDVEVTGVDRSQDTRVMTKASLSERLRCQTMTVDLDGGSGDIKRGEFHKDVRFERGRSRASARKALFESSFLMLREGPPELIDEAIGTRLTADSINLGMEERQGEVSARGQVRHVLRGGGQQQSGLLGGDELLASGRFFNYDSKTRVTQYRDNAILRSAKSEIRGESITITDGSAGRQLSASGAVVTLMTGNAKDSAVDARADAMQYSEQHRELIYRGNADLHQGALRVKTPQSIIVTLAEEGGLQRMIAGDTQVEAATDGGRRASGRQLTYTPVDGKLSIVGRPAQFTDLSRTVEGLSLTFYLGDDRIAIDGQDVQRTITRIPREIPQP
ncbi:MAG: hypothetical protein MUF51_08540 [Vicinamibacteria bacterium]|nr:hypothetical protein [Vicinamibacteria bacterium]